MLVVSVQDAEGLLSAIKGGIDSKRIETWEYDSDGDFIHSVAQWRNKAWLRPQVSSGEIRLRLLPPQDRTVSDAVYGVYHGRFTEMLLTHFRKSVTSIVAT